MPRSVMDSVTGTQFCDPGSIPEIRKTFFNFYKLFYGYFNDNTFKNGILKRFLVFLFFCFFTFRHIHKIGIYSYRPDIKGEIGGERGEVSKKNQNSFHKTW